MKFSVFNICSSFDTEKALALLFNLGLFEVIPPVNAVDLVIQILPCSHYLIWAFLALPLHLPTKATNTIRLINRTMNWILHVPFIWRFDPINPHQNSELYNARDYVIIAKWKRFSNTGSWVVHTIWRLQFILNKCNINSLLTHLELGKLLNIVSVFSSRLEFFFSWQEIYSV